MRSKAVLGVMGVMGALVALVVVVLLVGEDPTGDDGGVAGSDDGSSAASGSRARLASLEHDGAFAPGDCTLDVDELSVEVTCGTFTVPARRDADEAGTFELAVAVLHAEDPDGPADPILYLSGGPGSSAVAELDAWSTDAALATRDVVLLDQRGTGWSRPDMSCPEVDEVDDAYEAERRCRARLEDEGVDLAALRTAETAADVAELREALGYDTWNLWGSSYGTRVALTVVRDDPTGVRSLVLEGAYPHHIDAYVDATEGSLASIARLGEACAADADCTAEVGDVEALLTALTVRFDAEPITLDDGSELSGGQLVETVLGGLGNSAAIGAVPGWLADLDEGGSELFEVSAERRGYDTGPGESPATFYVIECAEEVAHSPLATIDPEDTYDALGIDADDPVAFHAATVVAETLVSCDIWDTGGSDPIEDAPVASDVPTLIYAGGLDPQTPPWWGSAAAEALDNAVVLELPHLGHDSIDVDPCARELFEAFLDDPEGFELTCDIVQRIRF